MMPSDSSLQPKLRWLALGLALACAGCGDRERMSDDFGRQKRAIFAAQHVHAVPEQGSPGGLDTEEAASIRDRYRKSLAPDDRTRQTDSATRVLVIEDPQDAKKR